MLSTGYLLESVYQGSWLNLTKTFSVSGDSLELWRVGTNR